MDSLFIEASRLGSILESQVRGLPEMQAKRLRRQRVKRIGRLLRDLGLVNQPVSALAFGADQAGNPGLLVLLQPTHVQGDLP